MEVLTGGRGHCVPVPKSSRRTSTCAQSPLSIATHRVASGLPHSFSFKTCSYTLSRADEMNGTREEGAFVPPRTPGQLAFEKSLSGRNTFFTASNQEGRGMNGIHYNGVWPLEKHQCSCKGKKTNNIESYSNNMCMCKKQAHLLKRLKDSNTGDTETDRFEKRCNRAKFWEADIVNTNKGFDSSKGGISLKNIFNDQSSIYSESQDLSAAYAQTYRRAEQKLREYKQETSKDQLKFDSCTKQTSFHTQNHSRNGQIRPSAKCPLTESRSGVSKMCKASAGAISPMGRIDLPKCGGHETGNSSPFMNHITIRPKLPPNEEGRATAIDEIMAGRAKSLCGSFNLAGDTMEGIIQCLVFLKAFSVSFKEFMLW